MNHETEAILAEYIPPAYQSPGLVRRVDAALANRDSYELAQIIREVQSLQQQQLDYLQQSQSQQQRGGFINYSPTKIHNEFHYHQDNSTHSNDFGGNPFGTIIVIAAILFVLSTVSQPHQTYQQQPEVKYEHTR